MNPKTLYSCDFRVDNIQKLCKKMVQVEIPTRLMKEVIKIAEDHPIYSTLDLDSKKSYVNEVLKEFVKSKGEFIRETFREEIDKILISNMIGNNVPTQQH